MLTALAFLATLWGQASAYHLEAVSDPAAERSWRPNGQPLSKFVMPTIFQTLGRASVPPVGQIDRIFIVRIAPIKGGAEPSVAYRFRGGPTQRPTFTLLQRGDRTWMAGGHQRLSEKVKQIDLAYGVALGAWSAEATYHHPTRKSRGISFVRGAKVLRSAEGAEEKGFIQVDVLERSGSRDLARQFVAYDRKGKALRSAGSGVRPDSRGIREMYFEGDLKDLGRVELQTRPYRWHEMKGVRVNPS